jgi:hypothetical protein
MRQESKHALPNTSLNERLKFDSSRFIGISTSKNDFSGQGLDSDNVTFMLHPDFIGCMDFF